jgi:Flp pilus assembly secretin CpaC
MRLLLASLTALVIATPAMAQTMQLTIDEAKPVRLATPITGVVVGNAGVADVIVHDANTLFVLGKSVGTTSIVAVDARGRTVYSGEITVSAREDASLVLIHRGPRNTAALSCNERCVSTPSALAGTEANGAAISNATTRSTFARGGN